MPTTEPHPPDRAEDRLLPWPQVREIVGLSRTTAWRLQNNGLFPLPVQVSVNRVAWRESEIEAWCAARAPRSSRSPFLIRQPSPQPRVSQALEPEQPVFDPLPESTRNAQISHPEPPQNQQPARRSARSRRPAVAEGQIAFDF